MAKKWVKKCLSIIAILILLVLAINFTMDPFWTFNHSHAFNSVQKGTNERQQKTNYIYFTNKNFNAILLGSSRTTSMSPYAFDGLNLFNYSASGMRPHEYSTLIDFTNENTDHKIDTIILAIDFFGYLDKNLFKFNESEKIISNTKSYMYRWKTLLSFDAMNTSVKNMRDFIRNNKEDRYSRDLVKESYKKTSFEALNKRINNDLDTYKSNFYNGSSNKNYYKILNNIKKANSDKTFIIYTTPVSLPLYNMMIELGYKDDYKNWLRFLVEIFGEIHHFMYQNEVTENYYKYFADSNHVYPKTNEIIAKTIMNRKNIIEDFGIILNKYNIEDFLHKI